MKITANELCSRCCQVPFDDSGNTIGDVLDFWHNENQSDINNIPDDDFNLAVFQALYKHGDEWHCTRCWKLVHDRLPSHMTGGYRF